MFFVYILQNPAGTFYVGHTENLPQRLQSHNDTGPNHGKFTRKNGPWVLVWSEEHPDRALAIARERLIKSMKSAWVSAARVAAAEEAKTASMFAQLARRMASGRLWWSRRPRRVAPDHAAPLLGAPSLAPPVEA